MILSNQLQDDLIAQIAARSGHDEGRRYIGLSQVADCDLVLYDRYFAGHRASEGERLTHHLAFTIERVMIERLTELGLYAPAAEISAYDNNIRGHPDGLIGEDYLEIKTLPRQEYFFHPLRVPSRLYWQVQAYMHFGGRERTHILCVARDTGAVRVIGVDYRPLFAEGLVGKIERVLKAVSNYKQPECTCGRCVTS